MRVVCLKHCFIVFASESGCPVVSAACVVVSSVSRSFNDFLQQAARDKSDGYPKSLDDLSKAGIRLVIADSNDPDSVGFVQWRVAFYVAGEDGACLNFLSLWDDYLVWKAKAMAKDIETHIFAHTGVDELDQAKIEEELNYEHYKARLCSICAVLLAVRCVESMCCVQR